jgi:hypothetical protein
MKMGVYVNAAGSRLTVYLSEDEYKFLSGGLTKPKANIKGSAVQGFDIWFMEDKGSTISAVTRGTWHTFSRSAIDCSVIVGTAVSTQPINDYQMERGSSGPVIRVAPLPTEFVPPSERHRMKRTASLHASPTSGLTKTELIKQAEGLFRGQAHVRTEKPSEPKPADVVQIKPLPPVAPAQPIHPTPAAAVFQSARAAVAVAEPKAEPKPEPTPLDCIEVEIEFQLVGVLRGRNAPTQALLNKVLEMLRGSGEVAGEQEVRLPNAKKTL